MGILLFILASVLLISLISFSGALTLFLSRRKINSLIPILIAFAAGTMIGTIFLHLLPEAAEDNDPQDLFFRVLVSFIIFFIIEKLLHWTHCHEGNHIHSFGYMNLIGDAIHNFLDGLIIAAAFMTSTEIGIAATIAVIFHEVPQEIGDFGILLKAGFSAKKAMLMNFIGALFSVLGGLLGYILVGNIDGFVNILTPFAAGSFLYIAATDLIPQLHEEKHPIKSWLSLLIFLAGILLMYYLSLHSH